MACTSVCACTCASVFGAAATVCFLVFGALMVVPATPFEERQLPAGITLLVLGGTGVGALGAALLGAGMGGAAGAAVDVCIDV